MLTVTYDAGVNGGRISLPRLVQVMETPAKLFGLYPRKGTLAAGSDADLVIWDPTRVHTLSAATQHSGCDYTLYEGRQVTGAPVLTMQRGAAMVEDGKLVASRAGAIPGHGHSHLYV